MRCMLLSIITMLLAFPLYAQDLPSVAQWRYWGREAQAGSAAADQKLGQSAMRVEYKGKEDWALQPGIDLSAKPGELLEFSVDVLLEGEGNAGPSFTTLRAPGDVINWTAGSRETRATSGWKTLRSRILMSDEIKIAQPRIVGRGPATVWIANPRLERKVVNRGNAVGELTIENGALRVRLNSADLTFAFSDLRNGRTWAQELATRQIVVTSAETQANRIHAELLHIEDDIPITMDVALDGDAPEVVVKLSAPSDAPLASLNFPGPIATEPNQYLVFPMNEGISFPADDPSMPQWELVAYGGHGICMPWFGATDGAASWMAILETPDDAALKLSRRDGLNLASPLWQGQRGTFGPARVVRYVFIEKGDHVAMAKRYRAYAKEAGLLVTFTEKRKKREKIDMLIGAVNVWCWDQDAAPIAAEMQLLGIQRILWSNKLPAEQLQKLNAMGILTGRYDIYQDLMDPANFPRIRWKHPDWTTEGFPHDIILDRSGKPIPGWGIEAKDTKEMIPCAVLCDLRAPEYARKRIAEDLKEHPYGARFIDTTTAAPWRECYHPDHPMTRTQSRVAKMELLGIVSNEFDLVCGSETGHDAAVPNCDYFEGMLSLGPYRVDDSGRNMQRIVQEVPEKLSKFQVGEKYRLPLWELVYHDACVAQWYWGDYNNKLPAIWLKRDLFNALYATPPMFMFDRKLWNENKDRFVQSYKASADITRATGYSEMTNHRFLTSDRAVQQTEFANGVTVTVNFSDQPVTLTTGETIAAHQTIAKNLPQPMTNDQ